MNRVNIFDICSFYVCMRAMFITLNNITWMISAICQCPLAIDYPCYPCIEQVGFIMPCNEGKCMP